MTFYSHNLVAWHDQTSSQHDQKVDDWAEKGFRTLSLSVYGTPGSPLYAAVMVKRPTVHAEKQVIGRTQAQYQQVFEDMVELGYGPYILTATGPRNGAVFASSFRKMSTIPLTRSNLSQEQFVDLCTDQKDKGRILMWADAFGTPDEPRYCAIWGPNPDRVAWNVDAVDEGGTKLQQRYLAMRSVGARPGLVSVTPSNRILEMFVDSRIGDWDSRVGMTSAQYQQRFETNKEKGLWPVCVSGSGSGSGARFAAIFAREERPEPRTFRAMGPSTVAAIDAEMEEHLKAHNLRGAALAVVRGTRLVYARGYTYAEDDYASLLPTTPFRLASISKTYCAIAIWRLIQLGQLTLDTTLQSVLNLTQPDGSDPKPSTFGDITIQHLLESRSGLRQGGIYGSVDASLAAGGTLPSNPWEIARWMTTFDLTGTPGDMTNTVYGNVDYMMLSLVVAQRTGSPTFEAGLKKLVLDPLNMTRTRGSRSLAGVQLADEARHHMTVHSPSSGWPLFQLECGDSDRTQERPLVPTHYGALDYEVFDGTGGLSGAVIDIARLCAMFSDRFQNPVLGPDTIDTMLATAVAATNGLTGPDAHGYHGLDWAQNIDLSNNRVQFAKGGWLPGQGSSFTGTTNDTFYIYVQNGNSISGAGSWLDRIQPLVDAESWGDTDLFPGFGMPSLNTLGLGQPVPGIRRVPTPRAGPRVGPPGPGPRLAPAARLARLRARGPVDVALSPDDGMQLEEASMARLAPASKRRRRG